MLTIVSPNMRQTLGCWSHAQRLSELHGETLADACGFVEIEQMLRNTLRDAARVPALAGAIAGWEEYLKAAVDILAHGRATRVRPRVLRGLLRHTLDFSVWSSLVTQQIPESLAVDVMVRWLRVATRAVAAAQKV